jgi:hypothetical protein
LLVFVSAPSLLADPCLVVYPNEVCTYHYDTNEYYTVTVGHPLYDPMYDRGGEVLIGADTDLIDLSIYQAPNLAGFEPSTGGEEGYFLIGNDFDLTVDGWCNSPTTYINILLVFVPYPGSCTPIVTVDGSPVYSDPGLGLYYPIGDLVVTTPVGGNNYSDTVTHTIHWELCSGVRVWAFADEDRDLSWNGEECFTAFSHDVTIPVRKTTWSSIKVMYGTE